MLCYIAHASSKLPSVVLLLFLTWSLMTEFKKAARIVTFLTYLHSWQFLLVEKKREISVRAREFLTVKQKSEIEHLSFFYRKQLKQETSYNKQKRDLPFLSAWTRYQSSSRNRPLISAEKPGLFQVNTHMMNYPLMQTAVISYFILFKPKIEEKK